MVEAAIARLDAEFGLFDASPIVLNAAHGGAGRDFANAVALVESDLDPAATAPPSSRRIERDFGRRGGRRWGPRVLDLDLVLWSGGRWRSRRLTVPHPQLERRELRPSAARLDRPELARSAAASPPTISPIALPAARPRG